MTAAVFGELTEDGRDIILIAAGNEFEQAQIAARLDLLTCGWKSIGAGGPAEEQAAIVPATWATVVQLGFSFNGLPGFSWEPQDRLNEWAAAETIRRTSPVPPLPDDLLPPWLDRRPRSYQEQGAAQIAAERKFLLLDEMGTGKSITALLGLEGIRRAGGEIFPLVLIVPSWEVGRAWIDEVTAWELGWPEPVIHKGPKRHDRLAARDGDIWITTYATLRADAANSRGPLVKLRPATVIADEIHLARNHESKQSKALQRIAGGAATLIGLSGTGTDQDTADLYPLLQAMDPRSWPDRKRMVTRFCTRIEDDYGERVVGLNPAMETEFFAIMGRNMRRVAKADVLPELPPKIYSVRKPDIPDEWVKAYDTLAEDMLARLPDGSELPVMHTLVQMQRLSQLASSAADVEMTMEWDDALQMEVPKYHVTLKPPSWKAESLLEVIAERSHAPVVCFTASRQLAMIAGREYCEKNGLRTGYVVGVGDGITSRTRQRDIDDFQAGKLDVIICTIKAGGTGITLTRSDTVVFLQRDWELGTVQAEDRCHRPGSEIHESIHVIDVIARGSVEDRVRQRLREKAGMLAQVVRDRRVVEDLLGGIR